MVQKSAHHHAATSSNPTSMGYNANLKTFAEVLQSHVCHFSHFSTQDPRMALLSGNHRKNRCFWRRSPIFLNLGWYILGSKWIAFPYHDRYIYHKHIYIYIHGWYWFCSTESDVLCKFPCDLFARAKRRVEVWHPGGASTPSYV